MSLPVSIVVPVHGRAHITKRCLDALLPTLTGECEVIVVDDASADGTPALLASYGERVRPLALAENVGYARACNAGAAQATHQTLLFLNNDTEPLPGWLEALRACVAEHPAAEVIGAKLLYPTGTVQHAGVAIGQDGYPHNLYAGLPAEHPAVNRPRALQAVTGACMLVRRAAFERVGGFDPAYVNSLEDVDLCLRIGEGGGEVRYCPQAVLVHLESASRGREARFERSLARWRERWREQARRDDLEIYAQDDLLALEYADSYPLRLSVSPHLGVLDAGRETQVEALLESYAGQVSDLLAEVVRLTALAGAGAEGADGEPVAPAGRPIAPGGGTQAGAGSGGEAGAAEAVARPRPLDHHGFLAEASELEERARALQQRVEDSREDESFTASGRLGYRWLVARIREAVLSNVPAGSSVLVVSRGDRELVSVGERRALHFPQDGSGGYLGHHPANSEEAIDHLERLRARGAEYLVLPSTSYWWLDHYGAFAAHLRRRYPVSDCGACTIYELRERAGEPVGSTTR